MMRSPGKLRKKYDTVNLQKQNSPPIVDGFLQNLIPIKNLFFWKTPLVYSIF